MHRKIKENLETTDEQQAPFRRLRHRMLKNSASRLSFKRFLSICWNPSRLGRRKQQNLEEVTDRLRRVRTRNPNSELRLRRVMEAYIDYWADNPDHYRSVFSMARTVEDRRTPTGSISEIRKSPGFGDTGVA